MVRTCYTDTTTGRTGKRHQAAPSIDNLNTAEHTPQFFHQIGKFHIQTVGKILVNPNVALSSSSTHVVLALLFKEVLAVVHTAYRLNQSFETQEAIRP